MAESRHQQGFPSNQIKGADWRYFAGCGGSGAGTCVNPAAYSYLYWAIKINPFSVQNSKLVLINDGFAPFSDAGPDDFCSHSEGTQQGFDVLLFHQSPAAGLDPSVATAIISVPAGITFPYELEFDAEHLPQPDHPDYDRRIWVALNFGAVGFMTGGLPQNAEAMKTVKLNWEGQP